MTLCTYILMYSEAAQMRTVPGPPCPGNRKSAVTPTGGAESHLCSDWKGLGDNQTGDTDMMHNVA